MSYEKSVKIQFNLKQSNNWQSTVNLPAPLTLSNNAYMQIISTPYCIMEIQGLNISNYELDNEGNEYQSNVIIPIENAIYRLSPNQVQYVGIKATPQLNFENQEINLILVFLNYTPSILTP